MSKKFEIKVGDKQISYENDGQLFSKAAEVITDIISPFSEGFGSVGDKIRIYRAKSLLRGLDKAKQLEANTGKKLSDVSPKLMIKWSEVVSAEETNDSDENDETFQRWANLLVNSVDSSGFEIGFIGALEQLTPRHAKFLSEFASNAIDLSSINSDEMREPLQFEAAQGAVERFDELLKGRSLSEFESDDEFFGLLRSVENKADELLFSYGVKRTALVLNDNFIAAWSDEEGADEMIVSADIDFLSRLGLLQKICLDGTCISGIAFRFNGFRITSYGLEFVKAVSSPLKFGVKL